MIRKILKRMGMAAVTVFITAGMFACMLTGVEGQKANVRLYIIFCGIFCLLLAGFVWGCLFYIVRLYRIVKKQEEQIDILLKRSDELDK